MKGNSFDYNPMLSSKILMSENYDMNQRGDHSMHVGDPLVLLKIQKFKNLFLRRKNACFHERK